MLGSDFNGKYNLQTGIHYIKSNADNRAVHGKLLEIIEDNELTQYKIFKKKMKINKASVPDDLSAYILKGLPEKINPVLTAIYTQSLHDNSLLQDWLKQKR